VIEHVRVEDTDIHDLFKPCVSGLLLGARRLVVSMARQCARIRDVFHVTNISLSGNNNNGSLQCPNAISNSNNHNLTGSESLALLCFSQYNGEEDHHEGGRHNACQLR
jgi:hypothetical protein